jgi:hypothetical protein
MEDRTPVIGKLTAFSQTGESEKVQILGLQRMRQGKQWCVYLQVALRQNATL